jgi:hypothetical protein
MTPLAELQHPTIGCPNADPKARCRTPSAHVFQFDRVNDALAQIYRERCGHSCWPPSSSTKLESHFSPLGNRHNEPSLVAAALIEAAPRRTTVMP